jgi:hypothetical protein
VGGGGQPAPRRRAYHYDFALFGHHAAQVRKRAIAADVEERIITFGAFGEVLRAVVDDGVRANGTHYVNALGACHGSDVRAEPPGDLHCECANAASSTVDEYTLTCFELRFVAQPLQGSETRNVQ